VFYLKYDFTGSVPLLALASTKRFATRAQRNGEVELQERRESPYFSGLPRIGGQVLGDCGLRHSAPETLKTSQQNDTTLTSNAAPPRATAILNESSLLRPQRAGFKSPVDFETHLN